MATSKPIAVGDDLIWQEIEPDGSESTCTGVVWALAGTISGMSAWWVIRDGVALLVGRAPRRTRAGRAVKRSARSAVTGLVEERERWHPAGGRYVDKGEFYRETDHRSRFAGVVYVPPRHVLMPPMHSVHRTALEAFATLCEQAQRGENVDFTMEAPVEP